LLPRLDTTLPRANFFAHKFTPTGVAILGHFLFNLSLSSHQSIMTLSAVG
jgi:hypothetical protein